MALLPKLLLLQRQLLLLFALGSGGVALHGPVGLASLHQAVALGIFGLALFICYRALGSRP